MDKHTPDFQEQVAIHVEMLLDDEMRAHAYADKSHELEFQVFRVLGGYREALDEIKAKDARIAELEAHQEYQLREEGALRDTIARLKVDLTEERAKVERLRDVIADLIAGGESAEQADPRLGYIELQTDRETLTRAREALAATKPRDLTKPRNYGSIEVEGAKSD